MQAKRFSVEFSSELANIKAIPESDVDKLLKNYEVNFRLNYLSKENSEINFQESELIENYLKIANEELHSFENTISVLLKIYQKIFKINVILFSIPGKSDLTITIKTSKEEKLIEVMCLNGDAKKTRNCCGFYILRAKFPLFMRVWIYRVRLNNELEMTGLNKGHQELVKDNYQNGTLNKSYQESGVSMPNKSLKGSHLVNVPNASLNQSVSQRNGIEGYASFSHGSQKSIFEKPKLNESVEIQSLNSSIQKSNIKFVEKASFLPKKIQDQNPPNISFKKDEYIFQELVKKSIGQDLSFRITLCESVSVLDQSKAIFNGVKSLSNIKFNDLLSKMFQKTIQKNILMTFKQIGEENLFIGEIDGVQIFKIGIVGATKTAGKEITALKYFQLHFENFYGELADLLPKDDRIEEIEIDATESILEEISPKFESANFWKTLNKGLPFSILKTEKDDLSDIVLTNLENLNHVKILNKDNFSLISNVMNDNGYELRMTLVFKEHYEVQYTITKENRVYELIFEIETSQTQGVLIIAESKLIELMFGNYFMEYIGEFVQKSKVENIINQYLKVYNVEIIDKRIDFDFLADLSLNKNFTLEKNLREGKFTMALTEIFADNNERMDVEHMIIEEDSIKGRYVYKIEFGWKGEVFGEYLLKAKSDEESVNLTALVILLGRYSELVKYVNEIELI